MQKEAISDALTGILHEGARRLLLAAVEKLPKSTQEKQRVHCMQSANGNIKDKKHRLSKKKASLRFLGF